MFEKNEITYLRRSLAAELLGLFFKDELENEVDKIPLKRIPKSSSSKHCCVYKDRAIMRYRLMSLLGTDIENEDDESLPISAFASKALDRKQPQAKVLTIIDIACASCQQNNYFVTDMCKGCEARPCVVNCPKKAVQILNHRSVIDQDLCISCGKCKEVCPYNAIVYSPVPCESKCPVGAISRNKDTGKEEIDFDKCIFCGQCTRACPFGTIMEKSQILDIAKHMKEKDTKLTAMVAPSIVGQFPGNEKQIVSALKKIGFDYVYEVAYGADITARNEALELAERLEEGQPIMGTSCCPAYVESVKKHVKDFGKFISNTKTPMAYTAIKAKEDHPESHTVFIGPCIAKKFEGTNDKNVDYVITYEELGAFFIAKEIEVGELEELEFDTEEASVESKRFCVSNGVTEAVKYYAKQEGLDIEIKPLSINGLNKKGLSMLSVAAKGKLPYNLVECMSCEGGCLAGPGVVVPITVSNKKLPSHKS